MPNAADRRSGVLPLEGLTVVDVTQVVAGPFASMTLGDLGADVIKVEAPGRGDRSRGFDPQPAYFDAVNRNKRSIAVDLKSERGQAVVKRLCLDADVLIESTKPGRIESYGLSYEDVAAVNPTIVYCSISGFGRDSPYEAVPAWDMLVQAMSGIMSMTGEEGGPPLWSGLLSGDMAAAAYAAQSILAALYAREIGDIEGEWIEVPMLDAAISWLTVRAGHTFETSEPFPRLGTRHPTVAPFGEFECADGRIVMAAGTDSLWRDCCAALDRPDLAADERFGTIADRVENRDALLDAIEPIFAEESGDHWIARLREHGVPAGPIYDTKTVWDDPHVERRELRRTLHREGREDADVIDSPVHFDALATRLERAPELLGQSTDDVLATAGYSDEEIRDLREDDVVG